MKKRWTESEKDVLIFLFKSVPYTRGKDKTKYEKIAELLNSQFGGDRTVKSVQKKLAQYGYKNYKRKNG